LLHVVEGRRRLSSYGDREEKKRGVTEVVVCTARYLGLPKNGNGVNPAESSKAGGLTHERDISVES
jgi:single-stranded DNA-binding protein